MTMPARDHVVLVNNALPSRVVSASGTNATSVKATAGILMGYRLSNTAASVRFFKLYNKGSAPTVGTDTPVETILLPAGSTTPLNALPGGDGQYTNGIAYAITGAVADSD